VEWLDEAVELMSEQDEQLINQRIEAEIAAIHKTMAKPGSQQLTADQMRHRADARRSLVTTLKINKAEVHPAFRDTSYSVCCSAPITDEGFCTACWENAV
jgi:uncharacterized protein YdaU (DUF1376 family)